MIFPSQLPVLLLPQLVTVSIRTLVEKSVSLFFVACVVVEMSLVCDVGTI